MFPFRIPLGPLAISPVELTVVIGIALTGLFVRRKMSPQPSWAGLLDLGIAAVFGGAVGSRLFYFVPRWIRGLEPLSRLFTDWSQGSGYVGGLVVGSLMVLLVARYKKLDLLNVADAVGLYVPLGFASGKIGCFLAGCCYGRRCDGFPGVAFRPKSFAYDTQLKMGEIPEGAARSLPVHPTQLYEFGLAMALFAGLLVLNRRSRHPGETYLGYVAGYSVWRFIVEFFRDDPGRHEFGAGGLSDSQISSLILFAVALVGWALLRRRKPGVAAEPPAPK